jgi:hypothetical protein
METWIENLRNPLVLVGFVVFILGGVISLFIRKVNKDKRTNTVNVKGDSNITIQTDNAPVNFNVDKPRKKNKK